MIKYTAIFLTTRRCKILIGLQIFWIYVLQDNLGRSAGGIHASSGNAVVCKSLATASTARITRRMLPLKIFVRSSSFHPLFINSATKFGYLDTSSSPVGVLKNFLKIKNLKTLRTLLFKNFVIFKPYFKLAFVPINFV